MPTIVTGKPVDMAAVAANILSKIDKKDTATVLALHGELGAGKTTLVQALAKTLGITEEVTSPTFVIMKQYDTRAKNTDFLTMVHIDAYRIEDPKEMEVLGFAELLKTPRQLICIEWAENIEKLLPRNYIDIKIEIIGPDGGRQVTIYGI